MRFYKVTIHNTWPEMIHLGLWFISRLPRLITPDVDRNSHVDPIVKELYHEGRLSEVCERLGRIFEDATKEHRYYTEFLDCAADAAAEILGEDATPEEVDSMVDELLEIAERDATGTERGPHRGTDFVVDHVPSYFQFPDPKRLYHGICECTFIAPEDNTIPLSTVTAIINTTLFCELGLVGCVNGVLFRACFVTAGVELIDRDPPTWERHRHVEGFTESDWDISPLTSDSE